MVEHQAAARYILDGVSLSIVTTAMMGWLPPIATSLSIIWLTIQITEWGIKKYRGAQR